MGRLKEFCDFVKEQAEFHLRMANKHVSDHRRHALHLRTGDTFNELYDYLDSLIQGRAGRQRLSLSWDELTDLPQELISELSISEADKTEFNVLAVLEKEGGVASLDRILVGYYRLTGEVMKRSQMTNRIYRMTQKGMMYSVPGRKGVYSLEELSDEDAAELPQ